MILRRIKRITMLLLGPLVIAGVSVWVYLHGGRYVETDNAYLKSQMVSISTEISGRVTEVFVTDHQRVAAGELLFRVNDEPYRIALNRAEARLASVRSDIESLKAEYRNKQVVYENAREDLSYFDNEYARLSQLHASGAVSTAQFDQAGYQRDHQENLMQEAWEDVQLVRARLIDPELPVEDNPQVQLAQAEVDTARLNLDRTETYAPFSGVVANFDLDVGEFINAGLPLFSLVDNTHFWIEANFKETDLTHLQLGQQTSIHVDSFPDLELHGHIRSFTPGTGSEFSLLPAQNSTGNWVKVVQRVSVNIAIDEAELPPGLTAGMSTLVSVDTQFNRSLPWFSQR
jgi:membrane fusion protein (multidrug efflux system)